MSAPAINFLISRSVKPINFKVTLLQARKIARHIKAVASSGPAGWLEQAEAVIVMTTTCLED